MNFVTGFNTRLISALGPYLTLETYHAPTPSGQQLQNGHLHSKQIVFIFLVRLISKTNSSYSGHRRTASLPSGPLLNTVAGTIGPLTPLLSKPSPIFPSLSQFTRVLDETQSGLDVDDSAQSSNCQFINASLYAF